MKEICGRNRFNIAICMKSYGKPSGINATEADFWFHNLCVGDDVFCTLVFNVDNLKKLIDKLDYKKKSYQVETTMHLRCTC